MRFLLLLLVVAAVAKPEILRLKDGPVKKALRTNYRIYLERNFAQEAEKELEKRHAKNAGS